MSAEFAYLEQTFKEYFLSEVYYQSSSGGIVEVKEDQRNIRGIFIHNIYFTPSQNAPGMLTFTDQFSQPIIIITPALNMPTWMPIPIIRQSQVVRVVCSDPNIVFTISYQYIM